LIGKLAQYTLLKEIGSGVFGTVFLAKGVVPSRRTSEVRIVAIKHLKSNADQESKDLLKREFELLTQKQRRFSINLRSEWKTSVF